MYECVLYREWGIPSEICDVMRVVYAYAWWTGGEADGR